MIINYDTRKISRALRDFYNATGIDIDLLKPDFSSVCNYELNSFPYCETVQHTEIGKKACRFSDEKLLTKCKNSRQTEVCICHAGLLNVAVPLFFNNLIIGYIIFGRMRPEKDLPFLFDYIKKLGLDTDLMAGHYSQIPPVNSVKIQSLSNIAIMLAKYLLLKNMIGPNFNEGLQRAIDYIDLNLENELSIKSISKNANISKNVLYKHFHDYFNCTVSEYIGTKRVERSIELMKNSALSIEEISRKVGFSSAAYYSRIFKKQMGISPVKYRKTIGT